MQRGIRIGLLFAAFILLPWVLRCTSRSVTSDRFFQSIGLKTPSITPGPADPQNFSFAIVGDTHVNGATDVTRLNRIVTDAKAEGDGFLVLLGDIVDKGDRGSQVGVQDALTTLGWLTKTVPVIGNHDIFEDGWSAYKDLWGGSHFSFTYGAARFIGLDSADATLGPEQFRWLKDELSKPAPQYTFLLTHYLPVVPGQRTYLRLANQIEAARLMKLATDHHVTAWLGAHFHSYGTANYEGVDFVVAGGGGGRRMGDVTDFFFVQVKVSPTGVKYELKVVP